MIKLLSSAHAIELNGVGSLGLRTKDPPCRGATRPLEGTDPCATGPPVRRTAAR
jgi:hypothetical protein